MARLRSNFLHLHTSAALAYLLLSITFVLHCSFDVVDGFECEELPVEECAFAVSSSGARCVLETNVMREGSVELECQTSEVAVASSMPWRGQKESADCVDWCGVDRKWVGLSSDFLSERDWHRRICAPACFLNCPNIVNLFTNLAEGEGVGLTALCEAQRRLSRKLIQSSQEELQTAYIPDTASSPAFAPVAL
ncbi:hypothetical protein GOP47_0002761 [Adiantum capillus-veneris]|uniref:PAR1 protein n=1 Tax=Adiantum capillus-veneris TaxID=13818 RepID=A0A9D4ZPF6_ADICA|nr:hypothetical protein GOP47_0002761 [Adiantum capillus-veneris]